MLRESLQAFIEECGKVKEAFQASGYKLYDFDDGYFAEFRVQAITDIALIANLTNGYDVRIYAEEGQVMVRIYENYNGE